MQVLNLYMLFFPLLFHNRRMGGSFELNKYIKVRNLENIFQEVLMYPVLRQRDKMNLFFFCQCDFFLMGGEGLLLTEISVILLYDLCKGSLLQCLSVCLGQYSLPILV